MAVLALSMAILLAMAGYSSAAYCVCNSASSDSVLQKNIDYACGNGADCAQILQNGACFNPNTVKDHCNYAVNNYYQKKSGADGSCVFSGTASISQTAPPGATSACYSGSSSSSTPTTPSPPGTSTGTGTGTGGTGTGGTGTGTGGTGTGGTGTGTGGTGTGTGTGGTGTGIGTGTGTGINPSFGLGPSGIGGTDTSATKPTDTITLLTLLVPGLMLWLRPV